MIKSPKKGLYFTSLIVFSLLVYVEMLTNIKHICYIVAELLIKGFIVLMSIFLIGCIIIDLLFE
jgi:hypothetical protein